MQLACVHWRSRLLVCGPIPTSVISLTKWTDLAELWITTVWNPGATLVGVVVTFVEVMISDTFSTHGCIALFFSLKPQTQTLPHGC